MKRTWIVFPLIVIGMLCTAVTGQESNRPVLTVEKIMRDPQWIGSPPRSPIWSEDSRTLYFYWNPEKAEGDSLYRISGEGGNPVKCSREEVESLPLSGSYNKNRTRKVYSRGGDIVIEDLKRGVTTAVTVTSAREYDPYFTRDEKKIIFTREGNLYRWTIRNGQCEQLTDFRKGRKKEKDKGKGNEQETWLRSQEMQLIETLRIRAEKREAGRRKKKERIRTIYTGEGSAQRASLSPDERFITYQVSVRPRSSKRTIVPNYITESGFTEDIPGRSKVGVAYPASSLYIYDVKADTIIPVLPDSIPGITEQPAYLADYEAAVNEAQNGKNLKPGKDGKNRKESGKKPSARQVRFSDPVWSGDGHKAVLAVTSLDNKDRWIVRLHPESGRLSLLDRQHDEAWIGGPGIYTWRGRGLGWMDDNRRIWFQSEESGYSHLYTVDVITGQKTALTSGSYEIYSPFLSKDKKKWYFTANREHPGERHFYSMDADGGPLYRLTKATGSHRVTLSPDERTMAVLFSTTNQPWELYLKNNHFNSKPKQITRSLSEEFRAYPWRVPEVLTFTASDGADVYARLYRPDRGENGKGGAAVIFVHGAGYLQNAHKWWSSYYREYMFHNLLADRGYTVLDIDYRGSAGYGRDWRTAIYRHMGGRDLSDQVDGAAFLVKHCNVDPDRIGIYGGSYGGFIALMALFTEPAVFAAGAALRPVTDWAHYNHGYTSNILNVPYADSLAYQRSSPIYHAESLEGALLICHGMVDVNVHFQDTVRLVQRLIELGKENWEVAMYPVEGHGFREPSSWTDEYRRILKLFDNHLQ